MSDDYLERMVEGLKESGKVDRIAERLNALQTLLNSKPIPKSIDEDTPEEVFRHMASTLQAIKDMQDAIGIDDIPNTDITIPLGGPPVTYNDK